MPRPEARRGVQDGKVVSHDRAFTSEPVGKSVPRVDAYEKVTGCGHLCRRHAVRSRAVLRAAGAQPPRPRPHQEHRRQAGTGAAGRQGRGHRGRYAEQHRPVPGRPAHLCPGPGPLRRRAGGGRGGHQRGGRRRGRRLVEVEYEELPAVFDPVEAAQPGAPLIHPDLGSYKVANFIFPQPGTNISEHFKLRKGDVEPPGPSAPPSSRAPSACPRSSTCPSSPTWPSACGSNRAR
jgi:hypothetical protein